MHSVPFFFNHLAKETLMFSLSSFFSIPLTPTVLENKYNVSSSVLSALWLPLLGEL